MFEICYKLSCHMRFSFTTRHSPSIPSESDYSSKKTNNRFANMELTAGESYSMWNFLDELEKAWNLQGGSTKKPRSLGFPFFGLGI